MTKNEALTSLLRKGWDLGRAIQCLENNLLWFDIELPDGTYEEHIITLEELLQYRDTIAG